MKVTASILTLTLISTALAEDVCEFRKGASADLKDEDKSESEDGVYRVSSCPCFHSQATPKERNDANCADDDDVDDPLIPLLPCDFLPDDYVICDDPVDHEGNETALEELGYGCLAFNGSQRAQDVALTSVCCRALECIECRGSRTFLRRGVPCIKYTNHFFLTTLLYSILLGFLGLDRFCLGKTGTAVGKLLTLGGLGIWWLVDIVLIVTGRLMPEDGSNWVPTA